MSDSVLLLFLKNFFQLIWQGNQNYANEYSIYENWFRYTFSSVYLINIVIFASFDTNFLISESYNFRVIFNTILIYKSIILLECIHLVAQLNIPI